ncbi:MAG: hypothetical protein ACHQUB_00360 [Candidatus Saccharimonadia bacterium]
MKRNLNQPAPEITRDTIFLSIDVESNGLQGDAFAVGAVLLRADNTKLDDFLGRSPITGKLDPWVKKNVLPPMKNVPEDYKSAKDMRNGFWSWFRIAKERADYVLVDNGYPVEARFLITCQQDDLEDRYWDHPFPLLDVSSLLIQIGVKPLAIRTEFVAERLDKQMGDRHEPRTDAWVSALAAIKALELSGRLS